MKILIVLLISCALVAHVHSASRKSKDYEADSSSSEEVQRKNSDESKEQKKQHQHHQQQQQQKHRHQQKDDQNDDDDDSQETQTLPGWSSEMANHPDLKPFLRKISERVERLPETSQNREIKQRVIKHTKEELKDCKSHMDNSYSKHCLGQLTGNTMALINRLEKDAKRN